MQKKNWNDKMRALLSKRKWDTKDWRRATKQDQQAFEHLLNMDTSELPKENLDSIYEMTQKATLEKGMLRFNKPVIIAVWAHKGGTGKSTTVANLSFELSLIGYNVLVIDTDSQSDVSSVLYPQYIQEPDINFYEAFSMHDDFSEGYIKNTNYVGLDIIAGSEKCEALEGTMCLMEERHRSKIWPKCLKKVREENYYDFILIDMDKTAGMMNQSILAEADYILSPIEPAIFSVKSLLAITTQIEQMQANGAKIKFLGIFYNKVDMRKKKAFAETIQLVESVAPECILQSYVKSDSNIENSQKEHLPLGYYNRSSAASKQTAALAEEVLKKISNDIKED